MDSSMHAYNTAGVTAAGARSSVQPVLGYGWPTVPSPFANSDFAMAITDKRQPRRLAKRST